MAGFFDRVAEHVDKLDAESLRRQYALLAGELGFFASIFKALREGLLVIDGAGTLLYANEAAEKLANFSFAKAKDKPVRRILEGWDWDHLLEAGEAGWGRVATREMAISYPERRILAVSAMPRTDAAGTVVLIRDVTAERAREADAVADSRADAVRDLAAGVAHEIGNPLNALTIHLQLLKRELRDEPDAEKRARLTGDVEVAQNEVKRLDGIIRQFLSALRPAKPALVPGSLADPLKDCLAALKGEFENRRIQVTLDLPGALPAVLLDRAQMEQVFFNLVKNALEAMADGGKLVITLASDDQNVTVAFRDNGAGMSGETLAHLFEPYRTTKAKGTGLGLMVSRRIVRAHGGEIDVESKEGTGTRFTVRIPRSERRVRCLGCGENVT